MSKPGRDRKPEGRKPPERTCQNAGRFDWRSLLPLLVILAGLAAYANSFSSAFVLDDVKHIDDNPRILKVFPLSKTLGGRRPVVDLSLAVNYRFGQQEDRGPDPWGFHAFNLTVHLLAGLALFGVVRRTLLREPFRNSVARAAPWIALIVALIWVVHPLQTQSVTYIIQRGESLMGFFYLLTLYCVIRGADSPRGTWWYVAAVVCCTFGMGSKGVMVTAPLMVLLYDCIFISRSLVETLRRRWGLYVGLAATLIVLFACGVVGGV
ncbi:MAG: glycosyltransferase family 39 protein, partial [Phycisphaerae bacterium]